MKMIQQYVDDYAPQAPMGHADQQWLAHLREIKHPLIMGQQPQREAIQRDISTKENHMQDHAYETRQMYIKDYEARVKLAPLEQRELWRAHLEAIKHPRLEPQPRRMPFKRVAELEAIAWERSRRAAHDLVIREAISNAKTEAEKDRVAREAWGTR